VRKQYHFWPGDEGLDAWDVDRLIRLSSRLPIREVPLESIVDVDTDYWFGGSSETPTVRNIVEHIRLVQDVDTSHPIILGADGRVMDGMHRIARAILEGQSSIGAVQFEIHPEPDYRNCAPEDLPY
jgi:elongation factor P hydroxylase